MPRTPDRPCRSVGARSAPLSGWTLLAGQSSASTASVAVRTSARRAGTSTVWTAGRARRRGLPRRRGLRPRHEPRRPGARLYAGTARGRSRAMQITSARFPGSRAPTWSARPSALAPPIVSSSTTVRAGMQVGSPVIPLYTSEAICASRNRSSVLFDAAPSVPNETLRPRANICGSGAMPLASLRLETGLLAIPTSNSPKKIEIGLRHVHAVRGNRAGEDPEVREVGHWGTRPSRS